MFKFLDINNSGILLRGCKVYFFTAILIRIPKKHVLGKKVAAEGLCNIISQGAGGNKQEASDN